MKVQILDALVRLTRQARRIEVRDVVVVGIEHVQEVEAHIEPLATEPERRVDGSRRIRFHAAILDQRARPEVAQANAAVPTARVVVREARRDHAIDRARNLVTRRIEIREPRLRGESSKSSVKRSVGR